MHPLNSQTTAYAKGSIQHAAIWDTALSDSEIVAIQATRPFQRAVAHANSDSDGNAYGNTERYRDSHTNRYGHLYPNCYSHSNRDIHAHAYRDSNGNTNAYRDSNCDTDTHTNACCG